MRRGALFVFVMVLSVLAYNNCSVGSPAGGSSVTMVSSTARPIQLTGTEPYVIPVEVGAGGVNVPLVTVKVCNPTTNACVTVPDVLLDTGSYGLRVYASALAGTTLTQLTDSSGHHLAECVTYGDGSSDWGPVAMATVVLGGETATNIPIQVINASFGGIPADCTNPDSGPSDTHWNGILGVGLFTQDCGSTCVETQNNRWYFNCAAGSSSCDQTSVAVALGDQVLNPVSAFPLDNQGVILQMSTLSAAGAVQAGGYLIFGIGTEAHKPPQLRDCGAGRERQPRNSN